MKYMDLIGIKHVMQNYVSKRKTEVDGFSSMQQPAKTSRWFIDIQNQEINSKPRKKFPLNLSL